MNKRLFVGVIAACLTLCGCSRQAAPTPSATATREATTTTAAITTTTTAPVTTATTTAPAVAAIPAACDLVGQSYAALLDYMDNTYYVIQQRGHSDVALALVNTDKLPDYEILNADGAFKDWSAGTALLGSERAGAPDALRTDATVTTVFVKNNGALTAKARVGMTVQELQSVLPSLSNMTVMYDFSGIFNRSFYGRLTATVQQTTVTLYVDLTTETAKQALAQQNITLQQSTMDKWMGQTVLLPALSVTAAQVQQTAVG